MYFLLLISLDPNVIALLTQKRVHFLEICDHTNIRRFKSTGQFHKVFITRCYLWHSHTSIKLFHDTDSVWVHSYTFLIFPCLLHGPVCLLSSSEFPLFTLLSLFLAFCEQRQAQEAFYFSRHFMFLRSTFKPLHSLKVRLENKIWH